MKHLWEVDHDYYCEDANYYNNQCCFEYKSWQDFYDEMGEADLDYNLIFRWDWKEENSDGESTYNGDDYYRNGKLHIYCMQQRKGRFTIMIVDVCRNDEEAICEYLEPRYEYLKALWEPV